jgi:TPP-dependent pyruvate/acetoin dehydrogenase alpha subunit
MTQLLDLYRTMARIRAFENAAEVASQGGVAAWGLDESTKPALVRGSMHLSTGQEAVPTGVCAHLSHADLLTSTHRGHGHTLAKGADTKRMMSDLFGRSTGSNHGKGGSMHITDFSVGMLGANGVVAAGLPIAVGEGVSARARALDIPALTVDGNDVEAVYEAAGKLIDEVRAGSGPRLLHALTDRQKGLVSVDPATYRDPAYVAEALLRYPLKRAHRRLAELGLESEAARIDREAQEEIQAALDAAEAAPFPAPAEAYTDIADTGAGVWL